MNGIGRLPCLERGAISRSEWDQARTAFETTEANVRISTERLRIAETGPKEEAIQVAENRVTERETALAQARQRLEDTSVRAPFGGTITGRFLNSGDYVKRADEVLEITDISSLEAEMKVPRALHQPAEGGHSRDRGYRDLVDGAGGPCHCRQ